MEAGYILALFTGLLGGFGHCIGMCGPLVASYAMATPASGVQSWFSRISPHFLYNMGRITTYAAIGGIMGLSGSFVNVAGKLAGLQNIVALAAGVMMIIMGLNITGISGNAGWIEKHNLPVLRAARKILESSSVLRYYPLGLLLGLLPCGLSYTVFIASAGAGGFLPGLFTSLMFGLGTLPAILLFGVAISFISPKLRATIYRAGGVLVMVMGVYYIYRGLRLYVNL